MTTLLFAILGLSLGYVLGRIFLKAQEKKKSQGKKVFGHAISENEIVVGGYKLVPNRKLPGGYTLQKSILEPYRKTKEKRRKNGTGCIRMNNSKYQALVRFYGIQRSLGDYITYELAEQAISIYKSSHDKKKTIEALRTRKLYRKK